ncbi:NAD(P)/FAD-dependent oxidoreductase [Mycobacterium sp. 1245805.9]|uniref:FAD-dependent oxidoreductase n=1 Tax=Mycobacterium sp. 1245805.9 TaxID=1856862 RepID=UPI0007FF0F20|nr:2-polyprenyl-6-methoxyphenol hydroxylase-like oxidoreductase [Mycobacterium sp. 1245805.9]OBI84569.1 2-polyprenyl-6-methoxyphenol hydroxylase-like oxidoreductase [Mycobacterium sp. 1245805.9]
MTRLGEHAVVLGASMAGMLAARVLSDFYRTVTVVERDELPSGPADRRGVPQGSHGHILGARGSQVLGELFPGILDELVADGILVWSDGDMSRVSISIDGYRISRSGRLAKPIPMYFPSRRWLEWRVRRRVRQIPAVTILERHEVVALTCTPDRERVTGARVIGRGGGDETVLEADLVVDATGRGSRTPTFLAQMGYGGPQEDEVMVRLAYSSQLLRLPTGSVPELAIAVFPEPGRPTTWVLIAQENDTHILTVGALAGAKPPGDRAGILSFGEGFAPVHAVEAVKASEPLAEVCHYTVPSNRWRRYDAMRRLPKGFLVIGDAICSFNPVYGQGMTVAALEAQALRDCLLHASDTLPRSFFRAAAKPIRVAWQTAVGSDLAIPGVDGHCPPAMRITNAYFRRVIAASSSDTVVAQQFLRITGMLDSPLRTLRPAFVLRVAMAGRRPVRRTPDTEKAPLRR